MVVIVVARWRNGRMAGSKTAEIKIPGGHKAPRVLKEDYRPPQPSVME